MPAIKVEGMHCGHCKKRVEEAASALAGVKGAQADLEKKELRYENADENKPVAPESVAAAIRDAGYEAHA